MRAPDAVGGEEGGSRPPPHPPSPLEGCMSFSHLEGRAATEQAAARDPQRPRHRGRARARTRGLEGMMTLKQPCLSIKGGARCVQRLDDSHSAVRIMYRISLRSSSSREPRYPLPKVVCVNWEGRGGAGPLRTLNFQHGLAPLFVRGYVGCGRRGVRRLGGEGAPPRSRATPPRPRPEGMLCVDTW